MLNACSFYYFVPSILGSFVKLSAGTELLTMVGGTPTEYEMPLEEEASEKSSRGHSHTKPAPILTHHPSTSHTNIIHIKTLHTPGKPTRNRRRRSTQGITSHKAPTSYQPSIRRRRRRINSHDRLLPIYTTDHETCRGFHIWIRGDVLVE
jgi:hypothetical protein